MAWSSTRSVIGLLVALSIPTTLHDGSPLQERDLILVFATFLVVGSLITQGLSLAPLLVWAGLSEPAEREHEEEVAQRAMKSAARPRGATSETLHDAARRALIGLRQRDEIGDEVLAKMLHETDLKSRAADQDNLGTR